MSTKYVYAFGGGTAEGAASQKPLLGGKGAGLAEMARLGVPVPPGFTITTEACIHYQRHDGAYPDGLRDQVAAALARVEELQGRRFGDPEDPLLVSVRSGAAVSMPGMMDTVLNLGLSRAIVAAPDRGRRGRPVPLGRLPPPAHHVRRRGDRRGPPGVREDPRGDPRRGGGGDRSGALGRRPRARGRGLRGADRAPDRQALPPGPPRPALGWHQRGVRLLGQPARPRLPAPQSAAGRHGHGGQRPDHGVRQPGAALRHRRRLHPQPGDRRGRHLRRVPGQRPGRGRGRRHPHAEVDPPGRPRSRRHGRGLPARLRGAPGRGADARSPLPGHAGSGVHGRGRHPLHAPDADRQTDRAGGGADRRRHGRERR